MKSRWSLLLTPPRHPAFWFKSALQYFVPSTTGGAPVIEQKADPNYDVMRDRHPVRERHNRESGWQAQADDQGLLKREYANYDEYVLHQQQKLEEMLKVRGGFTRQQILFYRLKFYSRFRHIIGLVPPDGTCICLGARQGTEVEVLRDLGFPNAYGIDLNPGPDNPLVRKGDFMHLEEADNSVDFIYTNCIDHAFDLQAMFTEHRRVLKPTGYVLYDFGISDQLGGGAFEALSWRRTEDMIIKVLDYYRDLIRVERDPDWLWCLVQGKR